MERILQLIDDAKHDYGYESSYEYEGHKVPRVTSIISRCIHSDGLMYWANSLGFKHRSYAKTLSESASIGTQTHNNIDKFLDDNAHKIPLGLSQEAKFAYKSYRKWYEDVIALTNSIICLYHEKKIVCPWFGGTLDGLYSFDGRIFLVDYKTSNHVTFNYFLQLAAYRYILKYNYGINIDGVIVLQLSKTSVAYHEHFLDLALPNNLSFMDLCERTFLSLVYAYYNLGAVEQAYEELNLGGDKNVSHILDPRSSV